MTRTKPQALTGQPAARWLRSVALTLAATGAVVMAPHASAETLAERLEVCSGCHGLDGNSPVPDY
ncbi:MAG: hypothetical protein AB3X38_08725, partial [Leptothrix ochracea]